MRAHRPYSSDICNDGRLQSSGQEPRSGAGDFLTAQRAVAEAGAFMVVLEGIPAMLADEITKRIPIPTEWVSAPGQECDMQVLRCSGHARHEQLGL